MKNRNLSAFTIKPLKVGVHNMSISKSNKATLSSEMLQTILDNCYDEITAIDRNGQVIYTNRGSERHWGINSSEMIGKHHLKQLSNTWNPVAHSIVLKEKKQMTLRQTTPLGETVITTSTPIFNEQGEIKLVVHDTRDLTQIELMVKELERTKQQESVSENDRPEFIAYSKKMVELVSYAELVANVDSNILILGESGTGKGVMANYIHACSKRKKGPFIAINCAAIPDELLESELFGYSHGAFTGADRTGKKGLIELADGGTLFLDEIGELSPRLQAKLLQFIQERKFIPIGGTKIKQADVRIVAATNNDLNEMVKKGEFRTDLFYRLDVVEITIPPLKERIADIAPLTYFFLARFNKKYDICRDISKECIDMFIGYSWPGNVRELENLIERLVVTAATNTIQPSHLPSKITHPPLFESDTSVSINLPLELVMEEMEKNIITKAYKTHGSSRKVASALNISQTKALRLIQKHCNVEAE